MYQRVQAARPGDAFGALWAREQQLMVIEVWPENWPAFDLFGRMATQWRIGMNGPSGLDYNVLLRFLDRMRLDPEEYDRLLEDVAVMERQALASMRETD